MDEKRKLARQRSFKGGRINFSHRPGVDCIIRNLTSEGACVEVPGAPILEDTFDLVILPEYLNRRCQVVWREGDRIGVKFL